MDNEMARLQEFIDYLGKQVEIILDLQEREDQAPDPPDFLNIARQSCICDLLKAEKSSFSNSDCDEDDNGFDGDKENQFQAVNALSSAISILIDDATRKEIGGQIIEYPFKTEEGYKLQICFDRIFDCVDELENGAKSFQQRYLIKKMMRKFMRQILGKYPDINKPGMSGYRRHFVGLAYVAMEGCERRINLLPNVLIPRRLLWKIKLRWRYFRRSCLLNN